MASPAPTEAEELAALNKALTALGFTDDVKLERFLHVLMPRVIDQMASKHESTKRKVLEILSHVNKRLKAVPAMPLPLEDLTALYVNEERPPTVRNFALIYVEQAHARAAPEARAAHILPPPHAPPARPLRSVRWAGESWPGGAPKWPADAADDRAGREDMRAAPRRQHRNISCRKKKNHMFNSIEKHTHKLNL